MLMEGVTTFMFTQFEIERAFSRLLKNGDLTAIAKAANHDPRYIQAKFDPNNPDKVSDLYRAVLALRAWIGSDYARGTKALAMFNHFASVDTAEELCIQTETTETKDAVDDWENVLIAGRPLEVVKSKTLDLHFETGQLLRAIERAEQRA